MPQRTEKMVLKPKMDSSTMLSVQRIMSGLVFISLLLRDIGGDHLDSLHNDFMELWLQFGHVFLFTAVYPQELVQLVKINIRKDF